MVHRTFQYSVAFVLVIVLMLAPGAKAQQSTNAQITGIVLDSSGAAVPAASVRVTDLLM